MKPDNIMMVCLEDQAHTDYLPTILYSQEDATSIQRPQMNEPFFTW